MGRAQKWVFIENSLGFSRISSTSCEILQGILGIFGGFCQVYMLEAAKNPRNL